MRDFTEFDSETADKGTFQNNTPFLSDAQVLEIAQNFNSPELLRQDATEPMTQDVITQPGDSFQLLPSYTEPVTIQPIEQTDSILDQQIFDDSNFVQPLSFDNPDLLRQPTTESMTQDVITQQGEQFQLLPAQNTTEANTMLDYPYEETTYQEGYAIPENLPPNLPPIDVVDVEPPKYITDLEQFPTVINDVDQKTEVVTLVVTSGQTGETVKVETTPEQLSSVVAAAVVADKAIEQEANQTATTTDTAATTQAAAEDLLFGYDRSTVYAVGGIAAIALLIGLSYFGED